MNTNIYKIITLILLVLYFSDNLKSQQTENTDIIMMRGDLRKSASLPTPFGYMGSLFYPLYFHSSNNKKVDSIQADYQKYSLQFQFYYDVWQFTYNNNIIGNYVTIANRNLGRDIYRSFGIVLGATHYLDRKQLFMENGFKVAKPINQVSFMGGIEFEKRAGDITETNISTFGSFLAALYQDHGYTSVIIKFDAGLGVRVPISRSFALNFYLSCFAGNIPYYLNTSKFDMNTNVSVGEVNIGELQDFIAGINLNISVPINLINLSN